MIPILALEEPEYSVSIVTKLQARSRINMDSLLGRGKRCCSFTKFLDHLRGPPSLLSVGFWRLFSRVWSGPVSSVKCQAEEYVDLYLLSLDELSTVVSLTFYHFSPFCHCSLHRNSVARRDVCKACCKTYDSQGNHGQPILFAARHAALNTQRQSCRPAIPDFRRLGLKWQLKKKKGYSSFSDYCSLLSYWGEASGLKLRPQYLLTW
jgi:hypothetical protein